MNLEIGALRLRSDELYEEGEDESDEVVDVNRSLFEADPTNREACNRLGVALQNRGDLEAAQEVFVRGLEANPKNAVGAGRLERIGSVLRDPGWPEQLEPVLGSRRGDGLHVGWPHLGGRISRRSGIPGGP